MSSNYCISCGAEIPEGGLLCSNCIPRKFTNALPVVTEIAGVPVDDALLVLTMYKLGIPCPNKDYRQGFEDGYKRAIEDNKEVFDEWMKNNPYFADGAADD